MLHKPDHHLSFEEPNHQVGLTRFPNEVVFLTPFSVRLPHLQMIPSSYSLYTSHQGIVLQVPRIKESH